MRLTKYGRQAFVLAVMADVPKVDYHSQICKIATDDIVSRLPLPVKVVWENNTLRPYINTGTISIGFALSVDVPSQDHCVKFESLSNEARTEINQLAKLFREQDKARAELTKKLRGVADACSTTQTLAKMLPEFAKYLPNENAPAKNLPAIANLVADFMKAGWPKGKNETAAAVSN